MSLNPDESEKCTDSSSRTPLTRVESEFVQELFERHRQSLRRYLSGLLRSHDDVSEIVQETYLRMLRQPSFEHVRANARAYLFQTATNLVRDLSRQRAFRGVGADSGVSASQPPDLPDWTSWPDLALEGEQIEALIIASLEQMNPAVRTALLLHRFREMTHAQIATLMGLSERTIERYIKDGLAHIGRRLRASS